MKLSWILAGLATTLHFNLAACVFSQTDRTSDKASDMPFVTVDRGFSSGIRERNLVVIVSVKEWQELWRAHNSVTVPAKPLPAVDFDNEMVVAVFSGEKRSGGYGIEVARIEEDSAKRQLRVMLRETRPPPGAMTIQALTQPYHLVKIKKTDFSVTFVSQ